MSAKWEKTGKTTGELTFEISQEEIKLGLDQAFNCIKKTCVYLVLESVLCKSCYFQPILW